ncbi:hypothetical protein X970_17250 [Pseudomonas monteilii SB3101]|uniref:Uncharacterized protein n=1 Tax=Pseudomonas monteilii SB3101 TaxID=1435058 RepID=V9V6I8_9PSED|nr:hypothetical protein X969_17605 [Pseudomonas monteilii SB3078]AHC91149.1 hypothetical protein X970_17250 [Pseudomonas monteilii SB3101]
MIGNQFGFSVSIGKVRFCLFIDDVYIRVPRCFELAWNSTGFYFGKDGA